MNFQQVENDLVFFHNCYAMMFSKIVVFVVLKEAKNKKKFVDRNIERKRLRSIESAWYPMRAKYRTDDGATFHVVLYLTNTEKTCCHLFMVTDV